MKIENFYYYLNNGFNYFIERVHSIIRPELALQKAIKEIPQIFAHRKAVFEKLALIGVGSEDLPFEEGVENKNTLTQRMSPTKISLEDDVMISLPDVRCKAEYLRSPSFQLKRNLEFADSLITYVQEKVLCCPNFSARNPMSRSDVDDNAKILRYEMDVYRVRSKIGELAWAEAIEQAQCGFCDEMSHLGLIYSYKNYPEMRVEKGHIEFGTHCYLVIERDEVSNPKNYKTWGKNCVICDPWAGKYFPISEVERELYDWTGSITDSRSGETSPLIRRFNPRNQYLSCDVYSKEKANLILSGKPQSEINLILRNRAWNRYLGWFFNFRKMIL